jgi:hypothetical protein
LSEFESICLGADTYSTNSLANITVTTRVNQAGPAKVKETTGEAKDSSKQRIQREKIKPKQKPGGESQKN